MINCIFCSIAGYFAPFTLWRVLENPIKSTKTERGGVGLYWDDKKQIWSDLIAVGQKNLEALFKAWKKRGKDGAKKTWDSQQQALSNLCVPHRRTRVWKVLTGKTQTCCVVSLFNSQAQCLKDPSCAIFLKSRRFRDIKYDTHMHVWWCLVYVWWSLVYVWWFLVHVWGVCIRVVKAERLYRRKRLKG